MLVECSVMQESQKVLGGVIVGLWASDIIDEDVPVCYGKAETLPQQVRLDTSKKTAYIVLISWASMA